MEKYSQIIILSNTYTNNNQNILIINEPVLLIDENHLSVNNINYTFDYLIFTNHNQITNFDKSSIMHENGIPVTNCLYQTTFENIYYPYNGNVEEAINNIFENN